MAAFKEQINLYNKDEFVDYSQTFNFQAINTVGRGAHNKTKFMATYLQ